MPNYEPPTLDECVAKLGEPTSSWVSRCHEIVVKLHRAFSMPGKTQYGFYYGPIVEGSYFYPRWFARHGWLLLEDGRIFDPTRWVFDSPEEPYIFCLDPERLPSIQYDFGMNRYREANLQPPPSVGDFSGAEYHAWNGDLEITLGLTGRVREFVRDLFDDIPWQPHSVDRDVIVLTKSQVFWLANYPYHLFGEMAKEVYLAIIEAGYVGFIPIDNRRIEDL